MSDQERWTVGRLLQWTTDYLKKSASSSPRLDAEVLLAEARGCQRIQLYTAFDEDPGEEVRNRFRSLVKRRAAGEPVAYLVGRREFYSLMFTVTPDVLIPRPETEFVVVGVLDAIEQMPKKESPIVVADVGTGSGAIAVTVAKHAPQCRVVAIDADPKALEVAAQNARQHDVADRIEFVLSDLFEQVPGDRPFDIIASNPPYLAESEITGVMQDVRDHEPRAALVAGPEGTEIIARILESCTSRLAPQGRLIVEISPLIEEKVRRLVGTCPRLELVSVTKDLAGLARVVHVRKTE